MKKEIYQIIFFGALFLILILEQLIKFRVELPNEIFYILIGFIIVGTIGSFPRFYRSFLRYIKEEREEYEKLMGKK